MNALHALTRGAGGWVNPQIGTQQHVQRAETCRGLRRIVRSRCDRALRCMATVNVSDFPSSPFKAKFDLARVQRLKKQHVAAPELHCVNYKSEF